MKQHLTRKVKNDTSISGSNNSKSGKTKRDKS